MMSVILIIDQQTKGEKMNAMKDINESAHRMNYKGHELIIERWFYMGELEETYFEVKNPDGTTCHMDWSGYGSEPTRGDFALWIDLNKPNRDHPAIMEYKKKMGWNLRCSVPLNTEYLQAIKTYEGQ